MEQFKYYAFISYSRKDEKMAKWLQNAVETYRLPSAIRKSNIGIPAKLFPLFRDKTDLNGTKLKKALYSKLEDSKYLIVLCSPNSAASEYVDDEVHHYIEIGRSDYIVPFIIDGKPYAKDPQMECFPPALRNLPEIPLGVSIEDMGLRGAFLWLISTILGIDYDQIVMRDKMRRMRNRIILGVVAAVAAAAVAGVLWYNTPHSKYYNSVTYRYEIPEGIHKLSGSERKASHDCIKITKLRGKVTRLEIVNAEDTVIDENNSVYQLMSPASTYIYDDSGRLSAIEEWDEYGQLTCRKVLTYSGETNQIAIDFRQPSDGIHSMNLSANSLALSSYDVDESRRTEVNRHVNLYDEEGCLIQITYEKDSYGTPACDSNGIYGLRLEYDQFDQVISVENLDENGQVKNCKYGWSTMEYTYDEKGNILSAQAYNSKNQKAIVEDGYSGADYVYDKNNNLIQITYYDKKGNVGYNGNGVAIQQAGYDECGHNISTRSYDVNMNPCNDLESMAHEVRSAYDAKGRVAELFIHNAQGDPIAPQVYGFYKICMELDDSGHILQWIYYDTNEEIVGQIIRAEYENGIEVSQQYFDENGQPVLGDMGYASYHTTLDDAGNPVRTEYRDVTGKLIRSVEEIAIVERVYDHLGNWTEARYYDEHGKPCNIIKGYASVKYVYENGNMVSESFYDVEGNPVKSNDRWHECRTEYDEKGNPVRYSHYDTEGNLCRNIHNFAVQELEYDSYGNIIEKRWYGPNLKPTGAPTTCREVYVYDENNRLVEEHYEGAALIPLNCYTVTHEYSENGMRISSSYFDKEGKLTNKETFT